ncbi:MAG TPA: M24 family metallopeptidase [Anaerolineaceae bacterium]|nr:M24 family metallopeptidase [Anaerolineaceae bacterium]
MKSDIDKLMKQHDIDVLFITGAAQHNPVMIYFVGTAHVSDAFLIKKRGHDPVLFHYPMEREEAAKSGLPLMSLSKYPISELLKDCGGNYLDAMVLRLKKMLEDLGIRSGRVAIYGKDEIGPVYAMVSGLEKMMPGIQMTGFVRDEILSNAMMTKEANEIEHIREMGRITTAVVGKTADYITGHKSHQDTVVHKDGSPVTIGEVKNLINLWLAEFGVENPEGTIFAIGRDAGIPHSVGTPSDPLKLGQTIVYDIYPCEAGGGYFYDFTRTWSLGYATDEVQALYDQVKQVYDTLVRELQVNAPFSRYQERTCELFEAMGHPTIRTNPITEVGYVHSLGHGIGLKVHEKPWSSTVNSLPTDILAPGAAFTLEPGLYYPDRGMGVRIEDSYVVTPDGRFEVLADFPKELILPVK